jgi:hypothetical protein
MTDSRCESDRRVWWVNKEGLLHRLDGPAREWTDGSKEWWVNGKQHRLGGPAAVWSSDRKQWWVVGQRLTQEQFERHPLVIFYRLSMLV